MSGRLRRFLLWSLFCLFAPGCAPSRSSPPTFSTPAHFVRAAAAAPPAPATAQAAMIAAVQSRPFYRQAAAACQRKDYPDAARLLAHLGTASDLSAEQRRFVLEQRNVCLRDAGLPTLTLPPVRTTVGTSAPRRPLLPQEADCGPRALLLVCDRLGIRTTRDQLRSLAGTTGKGTSLAGLAKAAQAVGLKTEGVQVSREALPQMPMPAIAWSNGSHFCAVLALKGSGEQGTAVLHDPNFSSEETVSQERLLRLSSGCLLLIHR